MDIKDGALEGLNRAGVKCKTWRKCPSKPWTSALDHILISKHILADVEWCETESDHMAGSIRLQGLSKSEQQSCIVQSSRLSKSRTHRLSPFDWTEYPQIRIYNRLSGKRILWTLTNDDEFKNWRETQRNKILADELSTSMAWSQNKRLFKLAPYTFTQPQLDSDGKPLLSVKKLVMHTKAQIEKATGQAHYFGTGKRLIVKPREREMYLDMMMRGINMVNTASSCGVDGIHTC